MDLSQSDVARIATLAKLNASEEETVRYLDEMTRILGLVDQLEAVDVDDIIPMAHPIDASQRLRKDEASGPSPRDAYQAIAPEAEQGLYWVPKVIE